MTQAERERGTAGAEWSYRNGFMRYVVPFYMDAEGGNAQDVYARVRDEMDPKRWARVEHFGSQPDLYTINQWMVPQGKRLEIGCAWTYRPYDEDKKTRPRYRPRLGWVREDGGIERYCVSQMGVALFGIGVGFLWLEIRRGNGGMLEGDSFRELLEFSNKFKELARPSFRLLNLAVEPIPVEDADLAGMQAETGILTTSTRGSAKRCLDPEKVVELAHRHAYLNADEQALLRSGALILLPATQDAPQRLALHQPMLGWMLRDVLKGIHSSFHFFANVQLGDNVLPDKALLYGCTVVGAEDSRDLKSAACWLGKGYNTRYKVSEVMLDSTLELFDHARCYIGREGCAYVADHRAAEFQKTHFVDRFLNVYFWVYMLMLQQSYGLLNFNRRVAEELPSDPAAYLHGTEYIDRMDRMLLEMNTFLVKNRFSSVSSIHHINEFYRYGCRQLTISEDADCLYDGLRALTEMQKSRRGTEENRREKASDDRMQKGLGFLSILAMISLMCDSVGLVVGAREELASFRSGVTVGNVLGAILILALWATVLIVAVNALRMFLGRNRERNDDD